MHSRVQQPSYCEPETSAAFYLSEGSVSFPEPYMLQREGNSIAVHVYQRGDQHPDTGNEMMADSRVEFWRALDEQQVFYSNDVDR